MTPPDTSYIRAELTGEQWSRIEQALHYPATYTLDGPTFRELTRQLADARRELFPEFPALEEIADPDAEMRARAAGM